MSPASTARQVRVVAALMPEPGGAMPGSASGDRFTARYLVQQRLPGGSRALLWEFPGGKVESGETDAQALARECQEELSVRIQVGGRLWSCVHAYPDLTVELVLYAAVILEGTPQLLGAHSLRYATARQMRELPFCEADLPLLDALERGSL